MTHTLFARRRRKVSVLRQQVQQLETILNPMNTILAYLLARLGEPSTWRGLFALLTALGITLHPEQIAAITSLGLAAIGAVNVFRKERAVKILLGCLCLLTLASCSTTAGGEKTFLGITGAGWLKGGKAALVTAGPILLEERAKTGAKQPVNVQP